MSKVYIRLLAVTAALIAVTGASFSIVGLAKIFAGASTAVAAMAGALEVSKLVVTGFLYRYWGHIHKLLRAYLCFAVVTLVGITSVGIFGFLSNAYQVSSLQLKTEQLRIRALDEENARIDKEMAEIRRTVDGIPLTRISQKLSFQKKYDPILRSLQRRSELVHEEADASRTKILKTHTEVGPVSFLAAALGVELDTVVKWLILVFVMVFDPLAVCLVFCLNLAIRLREKYRGNEVRIAAHSISTPVDHRFKRVA